MVLAATGLPGEPRGPMSLLGVSVFAANSEAAVNVDVDATLFVQLVLFVFFLFTLKPLLFDPMMKLFEEREKRIEGTRRKASKEDERSAKALAEYEKILAAAREAGASERDQLRSAGAKQESELLGGVRAQTAATVEQGRAAISQEATSARQALRTQAPGLGRELASRVLGREVSP
jgi:F-type H+-transporting ATPase subunit b